MQLQKDWPALQLRCGVCPLCCQTIGRAAACSRTYQVGLPPGLQSVSTCLPETLQGLPAYAPVLTKHWQGGLSFRKSLEVLDASASSTQSVLAVLTAV